MECVISGFRDGIGQGFDLRFCVDVDSYLVELDDCGRLSRARTRSSRVLASIVPLPWSQAEEAIHTVSVIPVIIQKLFVILASHKPQSPNLLGRYTKLPLADAKQ